MTVPLITGLGLMPLQVMVSFGCLPSYSCSVAFDVEESLNRPRWPVLKKIGCDRDCDRSILVVLVLRRNVRLKSPLVSKLLARLGLTGT